VLVVLQFPIADMRPFMPAPASRSRPPHWPPRQSTPAEFVHGFGPARVRNRGADNAWLDERVFCRANRAVRFVEMSRGDGPEHVRCAFRRLLSDGRAVSRIEVGIGWLPAYEQTELWSFWDSELQSKSNPTRRVPDIDPIAMVERVIDLPTAVHSLDGRALVRPLILQGAALRNLYLEATTKGRNGVPRNGVEAGAPLVLIECKSSWLEKLPLGFVDVVAGGPSRLAYGRLKSKWGTFGVWLMGVDQSSFAENRSMRLCLLRLHAEQEVLDLVLTGLASGQLRYASEDGVSEQLESYLNEATRVVFRKHWSGIDQSRILAAFDAIEGTENRGQRDNLGQKLEGARRQVVEKVKAFERRAYIREARFISLSGNAKYTERDMSTYNITNSIVNIKSTLNHVIQQIQAVPQASDADRKELEDLVKKLQAQLEDVAKKKPDEADAVAAQTKALVDQASQAKPNKTLLNITKDGLLSAAKAVADIAPTVLETAGAIAKWVVRLGLL
jgi:hypothetical protein